MLNSDAAQLNDNIKPITLISYNVYFDNSSGKERYPKIIDLLSKRKYDLIALQECTSEFIELVAADKILGKFTMISGDSRQGYSNIILTQLPLSNSGNLEIPTRMGRSAPFVVLNSLNLIVVNVHLESGDSEQALRGRQIKEITSVTKEINNSIILGDFNFSQGSEEEKLLSEFIDVGYQANLVTYDVENNPLARHTKGWFEKSGRLDRIMVRCKNCLLGSLTVFKNDFSDHWPVVTNISFRK